MSRTQIPMQTLAVLSVSVVVVGFIAGVLITFEVDDSDRTASTSSTPPSSAPPSPTSVSVETTTSAEPVAAPASTARAVSPTTTAAPSTSVPAPPPPTAPAPADLEVRFSRDSTGTMLVPRTGTSVVVVRNVGGSAGDYTVQSVGWVTADGLPTVAGTIGPGESRAISIKAVGGAPSGGPSGTVTVYDAGGLIVTIPALVV